MKIVVEIPPMYREIARRFPAAASDGVVFTWGDTIYSPSGSDLPRDLIAHEAVHQGQQELAGGPSEWWIRYLADSDFVLEQEVPAYRRQYAVFCQLHRNKGQRGRALHNMAAALSSPLYGSLIDFDSARRRIRG